MAPPRPCWLLLRLPLRLPGLLTLLTLTCEPDDPGEDE